jgi:hypothetical protein
MTYSELYEHLHGKFPGAHPHNLEGVGIELRRPQSNHCLQITIDGDLFGVIPTSASTETKPEGRPISYRTLESLDRRIVEFLAGTE